MPLFSTQKNYSLPSKVAQSQNETPIPAENTHTITKIHKDTHTYPKARLTNTRNTHGL